MNNLEKIFAALREYRSRIARYREEYNTAFKALEEYDGSVYYEKQVDQITRKLEEDLKFSREQATKQLDPVFVEMRKNAAREKPPAPTSEMIDALNILKMKDNITWEELQTTAELCRSNPLAFSVCVELSQKHKIPITGKTPTTGTSEVFDSIDLLESHAIWTLRLDKVNAKSAYLGAAIAEKMPTGYEYDPDGALKAYHDRDFTTPEELGKFCGIQNIDKFNSIVM